MLRKSRCGFAITSICVLLVFSVSVAAATTPATEISIGPPGAITTDSLGNVFFSSPNLVLKLDTHGSLARVAGNVTAGYSGDGGPATQALLSFPASYPEMVRDPIDFSPLIAGLAVDTFGNLYIADAYNNQVRKVDAQGVITAVAAPSPLSFDAKWPQGIATDAVGNLYISYAYGALLKRTADGVDSTLAAVQCQIGSPESGLCLPEAIAVDARGNVYVPDGFCRVGKVAPDGSLVTVAGEDGSPEAGFQFICGFSGDGGPATHAALSNQPYGVAVDSSGNLYIADTYNNRIRKVDAAGIITTVAGTSSPGYSGDGGLAVNAQLNSPHGVAVDGAGNIYIADSGNNRIRKVSSDGVITTVAGNGNASPYQGPAQSSSGGIDLNQHGLTGSWFEPATAGQGLEIEMYPDAVSGTGTTFVSWFTYDASSGGADHQRWYTAQGSVITGQPSASLTIFLNSFGNFNAPPPSIAQWVGTATLSFDTCTSGQFSYDLTDIDGLGPKGTIPLTRLTQNVTCSTTNPPPIDPDFALSGNWFGGKATSGQGFTVEANPLSGVLFVAWYTYALNGTTVGVDGQRWYTAQGAFAPGTRSIPVTIYETTGGMFDTPTPSVQKTVTVGTGTMAFQSCSAATFSYAFTGGTSVGLSGTINLSRVGPVPLGCA